MNSKLRNSSLALVFLLNAAVCFADDSFSFIKHYPWAQTSQPNNGRYEIVQSALSAHWTFLLDKKLGRVWQWVPADKGDFMWERMTVENIGNVESTKETDNRFQIFASGQSGKATFLLDTKSGKSWQLTKVVDNKGNNELEWDVLPFESE